VLVLGLLVLAGANLVYPAGMALAAVIVGFVVRRRGQHRRQRLAPGADGEIHELTRDAV
jgi:hypothetical protein